MADSAHSPADAARHLKELSADVRAAVVLDAKRRLAASEGDVTDPDEMAELVAELLEHAAGAAGDAGAPSQIEVAVTGGTVYVVAHEKWTIGIVAARSALSSLMFYDVRSALSLLESRQAA